MCLEEVFAEATWGTSAQINAIAQRVRGRLGRGLRGNEIESLQK